MNELEKFLDKHKKEIEQYFQFLNELNIDENKSYTVSILGDITQKEMIFALNETHTQIFKSNTIVLLYNSIEGTIYKSLQFILDKINDEKLGYQNVIKEVQEIWLKSKFPVGTNLDEIEFDKIFERMHKVLNEKVEINITEFRERNRGYFGKNNINDNVVHDELFPKIGLGVGQKIVESRLNDIKNDRNSLAHGSSSFAELGAKKTFRDLIQDKDKTFKYLDKYVNVISTYVKNKKYKV